MELNCESDLKTTKKLTTPFTEYYFLNKNSLIYSSSLCDGGEDLFINFLNEDQ
ncbi:MAG: hypothetical protein EZS28_045146, partial [Streblomastix strix]